MWLLELQLHHLTFFWQRSSWPTLGEEKKHIQGTELQVTAAPPAAAPQGQPGVSCLNPHPLSLSGIPPTTQQQICPSM